MLLSGKVNDVMTTTYDAVVVGGGPAGASAAHVLALGGARVLLLEKAHIPRYKPCGGGITARARAASPLVASFPMDTNATAVLVPGGKEEVTCPLPAPVGMTMRDRFDAYLVEQAAAAGAEVRDGCALAALEPDDQGLRLQAGRDTIEARYIVGADGANGVTAKLAGFPPIADPGAAVEVELAVPECARTRYQDAALLDFLVIQGGYGWIFGKGEHLSVGLGVFHGKDRHDLRPALLRLLARYPDLRDGKVLLQRGHLVPLAGGRKTWRRGNVLLAGDAAALADPLTAEGISYALASGRRSGTTILAALQGTPDILASYDRYIDDELCHDFRYARIVAALSYRYPDVVVRLAAEDPTLRETNTAAVSGTSDYRALVLQMARKTPTLLRALLTRGRAAA